MTSRLCFCCVLAVALILPCGARAADDIDLSGYTCAQFLADTSDPANGEKLLRSLMMISWATGFAAAFQKSAPRADPTGMRLMAATLGVACRRQPEQTTVQAIVKSINDAASLNVKTRGSPARYRSKRQ